mgnify:CR=1 FL=1|nr:MAG TPA: haloacid dehalogenase-like hydrolase [Caudoviricetes sp.]
MRLIRRLVGNAVVFPLDGTIVEGVLHAVDRTGYMWVTDAVADGTTLGDIVLEIPQWVRRRTSE